MKSKTLVTILLALFSVLSLNAQEEYNIVYIGNSITYGALHKDPSKTAPPVVCSQWLEKQGLGKVNYTNCGISGTTTFDYVPIYKKGHKTNFNFLVDRTKKLVGAHPGAKLVFSVMLGTNDAAERPFNSFTTPYKYHENLSLIIDSLAAHWPDAIFVLHKTIWHSAPYTSQGGSYLSKESLKLYSAYFNECGKIAKAHPGKVFLGDKGAYNYFKSHVSQLNHEHGRNNVDFWLHPTEEGSAALAEYWGKAILKVLGKKNN